MKNFFTKLSLFSLLSAMLVLLSLTSCEVEPWNPYPPNQWTNNFYDSRLNGYWMLESINNVPVSRYDANYLFFNGSGRGVYYYYLNNHPYSETLAYWCQNSGMGVSRYQINIQYAGNGQASTMSYWFDGGYYLYMQWTNQSGRQTYIYRSYPRAPWY